MHECKHDWEPERDGDGNLDFKSNRAMCPVPVVYVRCKQCAARTWLTEAQMSVNSNEGKDHEG